METVGKLLCVLRFGADQKSCESSAEFAPLFFLLFLAFRGCQSARKERSFTNYVNDLSALTVETKQLSDQFFGTLKNGVKEGEGRIAYPDGSTYEAERSVRISRRTGKDI